MRLVAIRCTNAGHPTHEALRARGSAWVGQWVAIGAAARIGSGTRVVHAVSVYVFVGGLARIGRNVVVFADVVSKVREEGGVTLDGARAPSTHEPLGAWIVAAAPRTGLAVVLGRCPILCPKGTLEGAHLTLVAMVSVVARIVVRVGLVVGIASTLVFGIDFRVTLVGEGATPGLAHRPVRSTLVREAALGAERFSDTALFTAHARIPIRSVIHAGFNSRLCYTLCPFLTGVVRVAWILGLILRAPYAGVRMRSGNPDDSAR